MRITAASPTLATLALAGLVTLLPARAQLAPSATDQDPLGAPAETEQGATPAATQAPTVGDRRNQGLEREQMWAAPTAEDWAKPCLIPWERTFDDAIAVSLATGKPILACVNMDGEIASEHYAGVRYRQPEVASLYEPYVCVIASVYRHTPRDYDEQGRRIPCPRFGTVTCGEHILNEPELYDRFLDDVRVSPRHIMIELEGDEVYDVYYALDTASVFDTIREGIATRTREPYPDTGNDRPLLDRVTSRASDDMEMVERAYVDGNADLRRALLRRATEAGGDAPIDLLRLAIYGLDPELADLAREALVQTSNPKAADLIAEALRVPMPADDREALLAALERQDAHTPWAKSLSAVYRGLATRSESLDVDSWTRALEGAEAPMERRDRVQVVSRLEYGGAAAKAQPTDPALKLELAEASLALAVDPQAAAVLGNGGGVVRSYQQLLLEDARRAALEAEQLGATGWRVDATVAIAAFFLGDIAQARTRADAAVGEMPPGQADWSAISVLSIFAEARREAITEAVAAGNDWPREWLTDVHAAYSVINRHPLGTEASVVKHVDFLRTLGAVDRAWAALDEGLMRYPDSWDLHGRKRAQVLYQLGYRGLEPAYQAMLASEYASPNTPWYAGFASLTAAEFHRRSGEREEALAAYSRAIDYYDQSVANNPDNLESADHYAAMALAGRARVLMELGRLEPAVAEIEASFARRPQAADALDGLNLSGVATAQALRYRANRAERVDLAHRVQAALDVLPNDKLLPAPFDRVGPATRSADGRRPLGQDDGNDG
ncbi:hypothetical protein [Engelhardtia mirabilis]|uniref:Uncharacterized protein n=1 Tax=Engelhardtia mirabilis TaxID=2528011 RepID=A0A518BGF0_9BACT|nr:hypothetical protein Pla133_11070 [Planctomycetes bacterium Pla133]QDV00368.1 hypothetical protein Pla86_11070 [Planctomycetes bacterium Pla86]